MKLTREQAIEEHRKMWLWISRQIMKDYVANRKVMTIYFYKREYLNKVYPDERIRGNCFCCEYVIQHGESCSEDCLLYWNDKRTEFVCDDYFGYYEIITNIIKKPYSARYDFATLEEAKRIARIAYKIAMLPVKEK